MKLLLDEMLSPVVARELRALGHDVVAIKERPSWSGVPDEQVLEFARVEQRAVVTNNVRDFRPLHGEAVMPGGRGHYGVVFAPSGYRRTRDDVGRLVAALDRLISAHPDGLANGEAWL